MKIEVTTSYMCEIENLFQRLLIEPNVYFIKYFICCDDYICASNLVIKFIHLECGRIENLNVKFKTLFLIFL